jgi:hypothetical protein
LSALAESDCTAHPARHYSLASCGHACHALRTLAGQRASAAARIARRPLARRVARFVFRRRSVRARQRAMASTSGSTTSAMLRLMSDLRSIKQEPPEVRIAARLHAARVLTPRRALQGCSASPHSEDNLFVWGATIFGPDETPWEVRRPRASRHCCGRRLTGKDAVRPLLCPRAASSRCG